MIQANNNGAGIMARHLVAIITHTTIRLIVVAVTAALVALDLPNPAIRLSIITAVHVWASCFMARDTVYRQHLALVAVDADRLRVIFPVSRIWPRVTMLPRPITLARDDLAIFRAVTYP